MSFWDMREWMTRLEKEGELRRTPAEVDWDRELGAITRRVLEKKGPALLFESIKGYRKGRCTRLMTSGLGSRSRLALALGFPKDTSNRELVQHVMKKNRETIPPRIVAGGPLKDVGLPGGQGGQAGVPLPQGPGPRGGRDNPTLSGLRTPGPHT